MLFKKLRQRFSKPPDNADEKLSIGAHTFGVPRVLRYPGDHQRVQIGRFCSIASEVTIFPGGNHPANWVSTYAFRVLFDLPGKLEDGAPASKGDVIIGSDVWIGYGATILSGVTIGHGAILAARSVVIKDVSPYTIAAGNPAKNVRQRFSDQQIEALLQISWWDWPLERILSFVDLLNRADCVDEFIAQAQASNSP